MRRHCSSTTLFMVFVCFSTALAWSDNPVDKRPTTTPQWGEAIAGCRVRVAASTATTLAGDAFDVQVELENNSDKEVSLGWVAGRPDDVFKVELTTAAGAAVAKTLYGSDRGVERVDTKEITVAPGGKFKRSVRLNRLYDLSLVGSYFAKVSVRFFAVSDGKGKTFAAAAIEVHLTVKEQNN